VNWRSLAFLAFVLFAQTVDGQTTPLDQMSDYALWALVAAFVDVFVVAFINQQHWQSTTKFAVFFLWCVLTAAVDAYCQRSLDWHNWSRALLFVFALGQILYIAGKNAIKEFKAQTTLSSSP
jgi:hypothetical protein